MFENNYNGLYPYNQQIGAGMAQQMPQYPVNVGAAPQRATSTLSQEDRQIIKNSITKPLQVTDLDLAVARCNHINPDTGSSDIYMCGVSDDGYPIFRCNICHSEFTIREYSKQGVEELVRMFIDFIHMIKIGWINPPKEYAEQIYGIQAMLEKFPQIFDNVQVDLDKIERTINNQYTGVGMNNGAYFNIRSTPNWSLGGMQQPMMMQPQQYNYGAYQQPQYQQVMPNYYQQNMMQQQQPMPMAGNPMVGQSPFVQGGQVPNMVQQPQQVVQPQQQNIQPATTTVPPINNNTPRVPTPGTATATATIK